MGRFDVDTDPGEDETMLVRFETRSTKQGRVRRVEEWVPYAEKLFKQASTARGRKGKSTELTYEPSKCPPKRTP